MSFLMSVVCQKGKGDFIKSGEIVALKNCPKKTVQPLN